MSNYDPKYDTTFHLNGAVLVPETVWMELKCKKLNPLDSTRRRDQIIVYRPRVPYKVIREGSQWIFDPLPIDTAPWQVVTGFILDSYVMEAFTDPEKGESLFMWDLSDQNEYRPGEFIIPSRCTMKLEK